ncbi:16S rRNA (cytosine(967)-C(5))-methyltransferase RsmB [Pseudomarimonas arenosa]|uniref:16S rRNA (cytosine(967)-C(5))-methyltransferase n=1 Tax=Pseudomarimonas arenosa TaxID=2774145 RepID=A0AAW3ZGG3_9GAMM|nr:16S rRNA (cytosine(967)-C(5))-methyltransferase RsmB [Pseudomarimonas arenosa]MBD8525210.1 16S rRNA (cytosine(967)-C(5))-methyltransferase RsmB [Pseudomarimonas arenosa]
MSAEGVAARVAAARVVQAVRFAGASLKAELPSALLSLADPRDRALCEAMVMAACRFLHRYECLLQRLLQRPLAKRNAASHALLLIGLAQLEAVGIAAHAAISATVEASRHLRQAPMAGLINAVLRRFLRERDSLQAQLADDLEYRHSHAAWWIEKLRVDWPEHWPAILEADNAQPPLWLRVNARHADAGDYQQRLSSLDIESQRCAYLPQALCLARGLAVERLPGFAAGEVSVQDGSAQLAVAALDLAPGLRVLDACAAPGGKTAALLEQQPDLQVLALDNDPRRVERMRIGLRRLSLNCEIRCADASQPRDWWDGRRFDRILLDAPCSASGVARRQPDSKWHRRASDIAALVDLQARLLAALWPLLKPGGQLLYATCSVFRDENEAQVAAFLAAHADARALPLAEHYGRCSGSGRQCLPGDDQRDGFFYALLERR